MRRQFTKDKMRIQWHPAFCFAMQVELETYTEVLAYTMELLLGKKPMQMDLMITKKDSSVNIRKNIGKKMNLSE